MSLDVMKMALEAVDEWEADTLTAYYKLKEVRPILAAAISEAEAGDKPVATVIRGGIERLGYEATAFVRWESGADELPYGEHKLYRTPPTHTAAVQAALERAAKVCEGFSGRDFDPWDYAAAIRNINPADVAEGL